MNTMVGMARSMTSMDSRNLLRLAVILLVAIVAIVVLIKVVGWFLSILPWLIVLAAVVAIWRVNKWRRRRLP